MKNSLFYEHKSQPLLPRRLFIIRMLWHGLSAGLFLVISLMIGVLGYHLTESLSWLESLLNAAMILGGMGPVDAIHTTGGKLFASFYALYSGVAFLAVASILIAPLAHRLLHRLHFESSQQK